MPTQSGSYTAWHDWAGPAIVLEHERPAPSSRTGKRSCEIPEATLFRAKALDADESSRGWTLTQGEGTPSQP